MPYEHEEWQIEHLEGALKALTYPIREVMLIRTRGGSKTQDTMKLCLYLIYLGFEGLYFTANASQLERPKIYMKLLISKSFLKWCVADQRKMQVEFKGSGMLTLENLTESKAISPRADFIVFDEERKADPDAYNNTLGIFSNTEMLFTIHISTPEKASIFEDNYDDLKAREIEYGEPLIFERVLEDVSFLWDNPARRARYLEIMKKAPPWFVDQEFHCKFVLPMGAVFQNVEYGKYPDWLMEAIKDQPILSGLDWNPVAGHIIVGIKWTKDFKNIVIMEEANIGQGYAVEMTDNQANIIKTKASFGNHLNYECSGINEEYVKWLNKVKATFNYPDQHWHSEEWDSAGINKLRIVTFIIQNGICIWVDKSKYSNTAKQVGDLSWDSKAETPKLKRDKASSPHYIDAFLHAASEENRRDTTFTFGEWY